MIAIKWTTAWLRGKRTHSVTAWLDAWAMKTKSTRACMQLDFCTQGDWHHETWQRGTRSNRGVLDV